MGTGKNYVAWNVTSFDTELAGIVIELWHVEALSEEVQKLRCWLAVFL